MSFLYMLTILAHLKNTTQIISQNLLPGHNNFLSGICSCLSFKFYFEILTATLSRKFLVTT